VSPWLGILIVVVADVVAVAAMLFFRGRAPGGGYYNDTQQAGWVYSVAGTSFAVVLAFVFLLTFQSYDAARSSSSSEAEATMAMFRTAGMFGDPTRDVLQGEVVCYARGVIALEFPAMARGRLSPIVQDRVGAVDRAFARAPAAVDTAKLGAAYGAWFADEQQRQDGRQGRLDQARPFVPTLVWIFLLAGGALVVGFVWLFADPSERVFAQAALPIGVTTIVVSGLVLVAYFNAPYQDAGGGVKPDSMERVLVVMQRERAALAPGATLPCDARGRPLRG
jgi:uncharacterized membrane protein